MTRLNLDYQRDFKVTCQQSSYDVHVTNSSAQGQFKLKVGQSPEIEVSAKLLVEDDVNVIELTAGGEITKSRVVIMDGNVRLFTKV